MEYGVRRDASLYEVQNAWSVRELVVNGVVACHDVLSVVHGLDVLSKQHVQTGWG